jgi:glycosylphosphatidylinositol transamidase
LGRIVLRFKQMLQPSGDVNEKRLRRRKAMVQLLARRLTLIKLVSSVQDVHIIFNGSRVSLFTVGYLWMLVIPFPGLGRNTYVDENALQPSQVRQREPWSVLFNNLCPQVNTYWNWGNVHTADLYLAQLEEIRDANFTSKQSEHFIRLVSSTFFNLILFPDEPSLSAPNSSR